MGNTIVQIHRAQLTGQLTVNNPSVLALIEEPELHKAEPHPSLCIINLFERDVVTG